MHRKLQTMTLAAALGLAGAGNAAVPEAGAVGPASPTVSWSGDTPPPPPAASPDCTAAAPLLEPDCDEFALSIAAPDNGDYEVRIELTATAADDWDLVVYDADATVVGSSGNAPGSPETVVLTNPASGTYIVAASPYAPVTAYRATASLSAVEGGQGGDASIGSARFINLAPPGAAEPDATFAVYAPAEGAAGLGLSAGEPTIGIPHRSNRELRATDPHASVLMYIAGLETLQVQVDERTDPPVALWTDRSPATHVTTLDPILHTDWDTGRTISTQLNAKRSLMSLSDDNGATWVESPQGGGINAGVDHQTVGSGPYPDAFLGVALFDSAFYYASQDVAIAQIARSDDGGLTWGAAVPMYNISECGGLHGHVQVSPADGTVYVPNGNCPLGESGFAISEDAGTTWSVVGVPGIPSGDDPGMAVGADGTIYFGQCVNDSTPVVAVSTDQGESWFGPVSVDPGLGLKQCVFPTMVAGDGDRAAFAFLASGDAGPGTGTDIEAFQGEYFPFVAITYDRGQSWKTVNVAPGDPVQRGPVCLAGTTCPSNRNLLDFNDIQIDEQGRIHFAYADGCVGGCVDGGPNSGTDVARIARQLPGSRGLYAAFDDVFAPAVAPPALPYARAVNLGASNELTWSRPADNGSPITGYEVHRRSATGVFGSEPHARLGADVQRFVDAVDPETGYCYVVRAINAVGASDPLDFEACAAEAESADFCAGVVRVTDEAGDQLGTPALDIARLTLSEPFLGDARACNAVSDRKLVLELDIGSGTPVEGNSWVILWNRQFPQSDGAGQVYDRNMVNLRIVAAAPECHFGKVTAPSVNQGVDTATLESADCTLEDGRITIALPTALIDDCESCPVGPGYELSGLEVRSFEVNQTGVVVAQTAAQDFAVGIGYRLSGNDACAPPASAGLEAVDDSAIMPDDYPTITIPVTDNDAFDRCDAVAIDRVTDGAHGVTSVGADGASIVYDPVAVFCEDYFTYRLSSSEGRSSQAVVVVRSSRAVCQ